MIICDIDISYRLINITHYKNISYTFIFMKTTVHQNIRPFEKTFILNLYRPLYALFVPLFTILCFATFFVCVLHNKVENKQISHRQRNFIIQTNNRRTFKTDTTNTNIYDYSISWLETGTSI